MGYWQMSEDATNICLGCFNFLLLRYDHKAQCQVTVVLELHSLPSCNHRLVVDAHVYQHTTDNIQTAPCQGA